mmetsp:Transcript_42599/g.52433  ORF Transcript_42599/g.52433 Transcript_42599/m.52433 type:complete len:120 (+) Transcript_42599:58-417(+)
MAETKQDTNTAENWIDDTVNMDNFRVETAQENHDFVETNIAKDIHVSHILLPSKNELNKIESFKMKSITDNGIDLSILKKCILPTKLLNDNHNPWTFETLLESIEQEYNSFYKDDTMKQ